MTLTRLEKILDDSDSGGLMTLARQKWLGHITGSPRTFGSQNGAVGDWANVL